MTVEEAIRTATLYSDDERYVFVRLPANAITVAAGIVAELGSAFTALVVDKDEVTLMMIEDAVAEFERRLSMHDISEQRYRLITFDVILEPELTGFIARISSTLADAGISIMPYASFSRDHILVPVEQFDAALKVLHTLKSTV